MKTTLHKFNLLLTFFLFFIFQQFAFGQELENKKTENNSIQSIQAPPTGAVEFNGTVRNLAKITLETDKSGGEFGSLFLNAPLDDVIISMNHKLWMDNNGTLRFGTDDIGFGFIRNGADNNRLQFKDPVNDYLTLGGSSTLSSNANVLTVYGQLTTNGFKMDNNGGVGKVLTSDANGVGTWQTLSGGGGSGSINGLSDGKSLSGSNSVFLGAGAGASDNSTSNKGNTALGINALNSTNNTNGRYNTALGFESMKGFLSGEKNTAIGYQSLFANTSTIATGDENTAIGYQALMDNISGTGNVAIGFQAGRDELGSDKLYIHNGASTTPLIWGDFQAADIKINGHLEVTQGASKPGGGSWDNSSDIRLKNVLGQYEKGLTEIEKLKTIKFQYKVNNPRNLPSDPVEYGFVAQEVKEIFPEAVHEGKDGYLNFNMHSINVAMVNAVQELNEHKKILEAKVNELEKQNSEARTKNSELENRLSNLESLVKTNSFTKAGN